MSDPRTDFFASGGDTAPAAAQDARTAFFASGGQTDTPAPPTVYDAALFRKRVGRDPEPAELANFKASKGVGWAGDPTQGKFTAGQAAVGGAEDALSLASGTLLGVPAAAGGYLVGLTGVNGSTSLTAARTARNAVTYQPRSEAGQAGLATIGQIRPGEIVPRFLDAAGMPNAAETTREVEERTMDVAPLLGEAAAGFPTSRAVGKRVFSPMQDPESAPSAADVAANTTRDSPQSMGAAAASPRISNASPQLQQAMVTAAQKTGGAVNPDALGRHLEADTLPVPVPLTEGEALGDVTRISNERNNPGLADWYNKRNGKLKENLQAIRDEVGPDVFTTNAVEHGDTLIKAYEDKDAAATADISAKYKALADANGGNLPMDGKGFVQNAQAALKQQMKAPFLPSGIQATLSELGSGPMTFENFENLRTTLAAEGRKAARSGDGNAEAAINIVRDQLENMPVEGRTADVKALADTARSAAKARFDALRADPAYKAAIDGSVPPDRFVQRFVTGGTRDNVALMKQNLAHDPVAQQTMGVAAIDSLRDAARVNPDGTGVFSQAGFNKQRRALDTKMRSLISPEHAETVESLGNVARYTQEQPAGHFINNSKTFVAAAAEGAKGLAEHAVNSKTLGIGGTAARNFMNKRAAKAELRRITAPGAGLDVLEEKQ
jgi:hypothetical protein